MSGKVGHYFAMSTMLKDVTTTTTTTTVMMMVMIMMICYKFSACLCRIEQIHKQRDNPLPPPKKNQKQQQQQKQTNKTKPKTNHKKTQKQTNKQTNKQTKKTTTTKPCKFFMYKYASHMNQNTEHDNITYPMTVSNVPYIMTQVSTFRDRRLHSSATAVASKVPAYPG